MSSEQLPLPYGWVQEFDPSTNHPFWVDTKADPPRAIWTHPYEDEQYLREHPDAREKLGSLSQHRDSKESGSSKPARRHSFNGHESASMVSDDHLATPILPRKETRSEGSLVSSRIRPSVPKKNAKHTRRSKRELRVRDSGSVSRCSAHSKHSMRNSKLFTIRASIQQVLLSNATDHHQGTHA
ncbi:hypothetical protein B0F90DRAFT_48884 [Multifurca ochricompacta]|uniref:WW domain-containing protein n=1 Tax=Multifurca ochricompacta TaxID=376703 RepID=A0AAD4MD62_9AGAM|nr:hypothetical protein B0F90DRAFT_48884 [Multifurca ochricompacta]